MRYVHDHEPGLRRERRGKSFVYRDERGRTIREPDTLARVRSLAIPPAWEDVWICPDPGGHLQATGRDARGRKQYRYHPEWRERRDEDKFHCTIAFGRALPRIRRAVARDLARPALDRRKVIATVVRLLETTLIRVGNEEYARTNHSFGLTTMRPRHARVRRGVVHFHFRGKSGTWSGTVLAAVALQEFQRFDSEAQAKKNLVAAIARVAERLGNTPAICRRCYIHPAVLSGYLDGLTIQRLEAKAAKELRSGARHFSGEEGAVLAFLERRLREAGGRTSVGSGRLHKGPAQPSPIS